MATNKKPILIRVQPQNYAKLKEIAYRNRRSISNQLEFLMIQYIEQYEKTHGIVSVDNQRLEDEDQHTYVFA